MTEVDTASAWITTLIQVGVPSLVAAISLISTFCATRAGHIKDIKIAKLSSQNKLMEAASERRASLVIEIARAITSVENAIGKHSGVFRSDIRPDEQKTASKTEDTLIVAYSNLSEAIDSCCGARANVALLGDQKISTAFELFLEALFGFQRQASPSMRNEGIELMECYKGVTKRRENLMQMLSSIYLAPSNK